MEQTRAQEGSKQEALTPPGLQDPQSIANQEGPGVSVLRLLSQLHSKSGTD